MASVGQTRRKVTITKNMKEIEIGKSGKYFIIDDEDFELVNKYYWHLDRQGYVRGVPKNRKLIRLHRLIMNPSKEKVIDHINRNPLDNRKNNLRICSQVQNMANRSAYINNTSGYKGICFNKKRNKYFTWFAHNKKRIYGGTFTNLSDAIKRYNELALKHNGEFAVLNHL